MDKDKRNKIKLFAKKMYQTVDEDGKRPSFRNISTEISTKFNKTINFSTIAKWAKAEKWESIAVSHQIERTSDCVPVVELGGKRVGRPSILKDGDYEIIEKMASLGLTDREMAYIVDVDIRTFHNWKKNLEFFHLLMRAKVKADLDVISSLRQRAVGFSYKETHEETREGPSGKTIIKKTINKYIPPDVGAATIWLTNRRSEWMRSGNDEAGRTTELEGISQEDKQNKIESVKAKLIN